MKQTTAILTLSIIATLMFITYTGSKRCDIIGETMSEASEKYEALDKGFRLSVVKPEENNINRGTVMATVGLVRPLSRRLFSLRVNSMTYEPGVGISLDVILEEGCEWGGSTLIIPYSNIRYIRKLEEGE